MGKNNKESKARKEELQAKRVLRNIFIACVILCILFIIAFSSM